MIVKLLSTTILLTLLSITSFCQSVGIGTNNPDPKAALDVQAGTDPQGMYIPRLKKSEREGMTLNASHVGLLVYDLDTLKVMHWNGSNWHTVGGAVGSAPTETVTEYYTIPPAAFTSYDTDTDRYVAQKNKDGGVLYLLGWSTPSYAGAGVHLPDGATVNLLRMFAKDGLAFGDNILIEFYRMDPTASTTAELIGSVDSNIGTTGDNIFDRNMSTIIDNSKYFYWIQVSGDPALGASQHIGLYGIQFEYSINRIK